MELKFREVAFVLVLALAVAALGMCSRWNRAEAELPELQEVTFVVHVAGQVVNPGVYTLPAGARVYEAIAAAGGATEQGDLHKLNLAAHVHDGQKIYVPRDYLPDQQTTGLVNINHADQKTLETLPGIGPALAQRIIQYREEKGGFASIEEIMAVPGIGPKTFAAIADLITVD